ncbi:hypothetical protein XBFM1_1710026 [Xenorhabdus bovienii str. feltiae Moldova]|uniref:Uncharacterized protein n=1 Tax=Xenorhabdus bovienii str. feltiae Moldova TaxID=1398200 RepID=A0A077NQ69_XENBV|nr:hypothetical protein XBFM1_1710026 [Xenorhabdus bovienii str. feltiae Moldova]
MLSNFNTLMPDEYSFFAVYIDKHPSNRLIMPFDTIRIISEWPTAEESNFPSCV